MHSHVVTYTHAQPRQVTYTLHPCTATSSHLHTTSMHSHVKSPTHYIHAWPHQVTYTLHPCTATSSHIHTTSIHSHVKSPTHCIHAWPHQVTTHWSLTRPHQITTHWSLARPHQVTTHCSHAWPHRHPRPLQSPHTLQPCTTTLNHSIHHRHIKSPTPTAVTPHSAAMHNHIKSLHTPQPHQVTHTHCSQPTHCSHAQPH